MLSTQIANGVVGHQQVNELKLLSILQLIHQALNFIRPKVQSDHFKLEGSPADGITHRYIATSKARLYGTSAANIISTAMSHNLLAFYCRVVAHTLRLLPITGLRREDRSHRHAPFSEF